MVWTLGMGKRERERERERKQYSHKNNTVTTSIAQVGHKLDCEKRNKVAQTQLHRQSGGHSTNNSGSFAANNYCLVVSVKESPHTVRYMSSHAATYCNVNDIVLVYDSRQGERGHREGEKELWWGLGIGG